MTRKLRKALKEQRKKTQYTQLEIYGTLGIPMDGQKRVEVPQREGYVYVKLRDNQNEVIEAFNNSVAASYDLPVIVRRKDNRYIVFGINSPRYQNNWNNPAPYLPKHGASHSFSESGGADTAWVFSRQMMPLLVYPSSVTTGTNLKVAGQAIFNDGTWMYAGNTGTPSLLNYLPTGGETSIMALIYMDVDTGNPGIIVGSGTPFLNTITGTPQIYPYIPAPTNLATQIPLAAVRLSSGTNSIDWSNLYDVRQWTHGINTGSAGGGGTFAGVDQIGIYALDDGAAVGTGTTVNFGNNLSVVRTGTTLFVDAVAGGGGGGGMGFVGKDEGVFQGTGTILNVVGSDVVLSFSGSTLTLLHTNPTIVFPQDNIGIYGQNKGVSLGTGTTLNVNGTRLTLTQSGTVLELSNSPDPQEVIGVYGLSNGAPLGTGTWLDFGNNLTASISGTVLRIDASAGGGSFAGVDQIGIYGLSGTTALGTGTSISFGNYLLASITGTTLYLSAHVGTGSTQLAGGGHNHAGNDGGTQIPTAGIQDDAVTFAKMQNFGGLTVLGNPNVGIDEPSLITFTATARSLCDDTSVADMRTTLGVTDEFVQDIVGGMITGSVKNGMEVSYDDTNGGLNFKSFIYGQNEGVVLGTGTTLNFVGQGVTATLSGTVFNIDVPGGGGGGGGNGIMFQRNGVPVSTGTTLNIVGSLLVSGSIHQLNVPKVYQFASPGAAAGGVSVATNLPAAVTVFSKQPVNLIGYTQANLRGAFGGAAPATATGTRLHLRLGSTTSDELALRPGIDGNLIWETNTTNQSGWFDMVTGAYSSDLVTLGLYSSGGNGVADPNYFGILAEFH